MIKKYFHAFADHKDEYFDTFKEAYRQVRKWQFDGAKNTRIYELFDDGENLTDGDCLYRKGDYPY